MRSRNANLKLDVFTNESNRRNDEFGSFADKFRKRKQDRHEKQAAQQERHAVHQAVLIAIAPRNNITRLNTKPVTVGKMKIDR